MKEPKFKRILLKLSGESLMGDQGFGIDAKVLDFFAEEGEKSTRNRNPGWYCNWRRKHYRGLSAGDQGIDRVTGDHMGMLATMINSLALQNAMRKKGSTHGSWPLFKCRRLQNRISEEEQ